MDKLPLRLIIWFIRPRGVSYTVLECKERAERERERERTRREREQILQGISLAVAGTDLWTSLVFPVNQDK